MAFDVHHFLTDLYIQGKFHYNLTSCKIWIRTEKMAIFKQKKVRNSKTQTDSDGL